MEKMLRAIRVGKEFAKDYPSASRFDVAIYLHGYDKTLGFNQLTEITREIGNQLNKPCYW